MEILNCYYQTESITTFFKQMNIMQTTETMNEFIKYHTTDVMNEFMLCFPPPGIWEVWNRWNWKR